MCNRKNIVKWNIDCKVAIIYDTMGLNKFSKLNNKKTKQYYTGQTDSHVRTIQQIYICK